LSFTTPPGTAVGLVGFSNVDDLQSFFIGDEGVTKLNGDGAWVFQENRR